LGWRFDNHFLAAVGPNAEALETTEEVDAVPGVDGDARAAEGGRETGGGEFAVEGDPVGVTEEIEEDDAA
jgi:hypothetical protein